MYERLKRMNLSFMHEGLNLYQCVFSIRMYFLSLSWTSCYPRLRPRGQSELSMTLSDIPGTRGNAGRRKR